MEEEEAVWFVVLLVAGVVLLVVALLVRRARRSTPASPQQTALELTAPVRRFEVVAIGLPGAGKTMLLTSMYQKLHTSAGRGFHVHAPQDQVARINTWYGQVNGTESDWPAGTARGETRSFDFTLLHDHAPTGVVPGIEIGYLEYAGELLADPDLSGSTTGHHVSTAIGNADALLGIIDGLLVLRAYEGDRRARSDLQISLNTMINVMLRSPAPVAFVVTKWDLLDGFGQDENVRLGKVRDLLLAADGFRDLVSTHAARRIVRLIPVSAVGPEFARLADGKIRKRPDGQLAPYGVELPFCAVVPDAVSQAEAALDQQTRETLRREAKEAARVGVRETLRRVGTWLTAQSGRSLVSLTGLSLLVEVAAAEETQRNPPLRERLSAADQYAEDVIQSRRAVLEALRHQLAVLDARLPNARLDGGR